MGFNANNSNDAVVTDIKLYTGLTLAKVVAINPTKEQLSKIGIETEEEPNYVGKPDENGNKTIYVDFYLQIGEKDEKGELFIKRPQKLRFFLTEAFRVSRKGTNQIIDAAGRTAYIDPENEEHDYARFKWIDRPSARPCYVGEDRLTQFLINWLNIKPGDNARLESPEKLFNGDLSELNGIFKAFSSNEVRVMLTVHTTQDSKRFQNIYSNYFDRASNESYTYWEKHFRENGEKFQDDYSFEFTEFKPVTPSDAAQPASSTDLPDGDVF